MKIRILSLFAIAAMAMCTSCTKEDISQEEQPQSGPFEVTISAKMSEFAPTTKSTAESCIRMKWSAGDIVWAPVNCGYEPTNYPYGKLYQWGRKYGCGYNDKSTNLETLIQEGANSQTTLATEDAAKFYYCSEEMAENYDWCSTHYYNLWDSSITAACTESGHIPTKTDKDPCPAGWRIPTYAELNALTGNNGTTSIGANGWDSLNTGYWFNGTTSPVSGIGLFLPAAGYRNGSDACDRGVVGNLLVLISQRCR